MKRTLGTRKDASLRTPSERTVELACERGIGDFAEVVVGSDVLLEGLTAVHTHMLVSRSSEEAASPASVEEAAGDGDNTGLLTWNRYDP